MFQTSWFKQAFNLWERTTSACFEELARNSTFLSANGAGLNSVLNFKKIADMSSQYYLSSIGLPTRRDQERTLHLLQQIEGRLDDLQFQIDSWRRERQAPATTHP